MKKKLSIVSALVVLGLVSASVSWTAEKKSPSWQARMQQLKSVIQEILTDTSSDSRFQQKGTQKRLEANAKKLAELAHGLNATKSPDQDPTIGMVASSFADEADHAYESLKSGHANYARGVLRAMTSYCLACHTRTGSSTSPVDNQKGFMPPSEIGLKGVDQASYLASIRQFDKALEQAESIVAQPTSQAPTTFEWEKAVRLGLAISIRMKKDPDTALRIVDRVLAAGKAPYFLRAQASKWKESLLEWKAELPRETVTEEGLYSEAIRLLSKARAMQKYPADRSADVLYLRASSVLHELLGKAPKGAHATEALYLEGLSYEVLEGLNIWDMHEFYYLACIRNSPHTEIAQQCYKNYEESVYAGYTGSAGTDVPPSVRRKLSELEQQASPVVKTVPEGQMK